MAFKGIDFAALSRKMSEDRDRKASMTPEQLAAEEKSEDFERMAPIIHKDEKERDERSTDLLVFTVKEDPYSRYSFTGGSETRFYAEMEPNGPDAKNNVSEFRRIDYKSSEAEEFDDRNEIKLAGAKVGDKITALGSWKTRNWKDSSDKWRTETAFQAERIGEGVLTREQLMARTPGGTAERATDFVLGTEKLAGLKAQAEKLSGGSRDSVQSSLKSLDDGLDQALSRSNESKLGR